MITSKPILLKFGSSYFKFIKSNTTVIVTPISSFGTGAYIINNNKFYYYDDEEEEILYSSSPPPRVVLSSSSSW